MGGLTNYNSEKRDSTLWIFLLELRGVNQLFIGFFGAVYFAQNPTPKLAKTAVTMATRTPTTFDAKQNHHHQQYTTRTPQLYWIVEITCMDKRQRISPS